MSVSLLLITNRKSEVVYGLLIGAVLDDLERLNGRYLAFFFTEFDSFEGRLI